jgi:hypothetical protein
LHNDFDGLCSIESEMSINFLLLSLDGLPLRSASNTEPVSWNFSISRWTASQWGTGVSGNFSANCSCTKLVCLLPSQKMYSTRKTHSSIERTIVSKNWIKQLHTLLVLHFNCCLTTECSETTAHFNSNFNTDNQIYVPQPKCTATFRMHCITQRGRNCLQKFWSKHNTREDGISAMYWMCRGIAGCINVSVLHQNLCDVCRLTTSFMMQCFQQSCILHQYLNTLCVVWAWNRALKWLWWNDTGLLKIRMYTSKHITLYLNFMFQHVTFAVLFLCAGMKYCISLGNLKFFLYNLTHGLLTWYGLFSLLYIVLWHCTTLCYCFSSVYCTVHFSCIILCLLVMYMLLP